MKPSKDDIRRWGANPKNFVSSLDNHFVSEGWEPHQWVGELGIVEWTKITGPFALTFTIRPDGINMKSHRLLSTLLFVSKTGGLNGNCEHLFSIRPRILTWNEARRNGAFSEVKLHFNESTENAISEIKSDFSRHIQPILKMLLPPFEIINYLAEKNWIFEDSPVQAVTLFRKENLIETIDGMCRNWKND